MNYNKGFKIMSIFSIIWSLIFYLPIFFIPKLYIQYYIFFWMIIVIFGILISPKIASVLALSSKQYDA